MVSSGPRCDRTLNEFTEYCSPDPNTLIVGLGPSPQDSGRPQSCGAGTDHLAQVPYNSPPRSCFHKVEIGSRIIALVIGYLKKKKKNDCYVSRSVDTRFYTHNLILGDD